MQAAASWSGGTRSSDVGDTSEPQAPLPEGDPGFGPIGEFLTEGSDAIGEAWEEIGENSRFSPYLPHDIGDIGEDWIRKWGPRAGGLFKGLGIVLDVRRQWSKDNNRPDLNGVERVLRFGFRAGGTAGFSAYAGTQAATGCGKVVGVVCGLLVGAKAAEGGEIVTDSVLQMLDESTGEFWTPELDIQVGPIGFEGRIGLDLGNPLDVFG